MLEKIKQFFDDNLSVAQEKESEHQLQLATTALFIEMMLQDGKQHKNEIEAVKKAIKIHFNISAHELDELFLLAEHELKLATDYYQFTQLINNNFSQTQKIKIIENLWTIAYADSHLDDLEEHMVRKIADLIHVPHMQFIKAKVKIQNGKNN
ncbi:MAG: TerB family tellurite resistance protein [gamma proteobacterium symbiont of Taylorina sp.]|nr:TerB family tellurite resistance protein [gamma proteobacterium symbiont of Taylorina sp.]